MKTLAFLKNKWKMISMFLALWAVIASFVAGYYWLQYTDFIGRIGGVPIYVNVGIDYGNQTRVWYNDTKTITGMTLFKVTKDTTSVTYNKAAGFGVYVESINGLAWNATDGRGWVWWKWDTAMTNWTRIDISSDAYALANNETFLWYYEGGWPPPAPS